MVDERDLKLQMAVLTEQLQSIERTRKLAESAIRLGKCFKYRNCYSCPQTDAEYWWIYRKVLSVTETGAMFGLEFQIDRDGMAQICSREFWSHYESWKEIGADEFGMAKLAFEKHVAALAQSAGV